MPSYYKNRFPVLIETLEDITGGRRGLKYLREELKPAAERFNEFIIDWLKERRYPLRKGTLSPSNASRFDELWQDDPTGRLHPGAKPLWASQRFQLRKERGLMNLRVTFYNNAPHAPFFFDEHPGAYISSNTGERLKFWAGKPLPWHPPKVRKWGWLPGPRYPKEVDHPGHIAYSELVRDEFERNHRQAFNIVRRHATERLTGDIKKALE